MKTLSANEMSQVSGGIGCDNNDHITILKQDISVRVVKTLLAAESVFCAICCFVAYSSYAKLHQHSIGKADLNRRLNTRC